MSVDPFETVSGTREEILAATYRALCDHGYADLTLSVIGDELEKSQSLIYHHYDGKDELVLSCLEYMLDYLESTLDETVDDPRVTLEEAIERICAPANSDPEESVRRAFIELRAQAAHDTAYREHFTRSDRVFRDWLQSVIEAGIDSGTFVDCESGRVAEVLCVTLQGIFFRRTTVTTTAWLPDTSDELVATLERTLYAPESTSK
ncbi:TetR/AcrR family transcriptional regulator [Natrialba sp. SSL1]|uniref:TetR/AcrR family transcriptional regulator n=1 Tax=Natrialba sp. SSL1 TaxID=1869245 RepID=UPI0008F809D3|nr:TetR/AcrR family transcriptional regulator [Natrialba sp. SSL1]OIB56530.1 TetR family transcriptional regulator [Natrialba sp. SSL1]